MRPFRIRVPDDVREDLRERLARTRYGRRTGAKWAAGTDPGYLRELVTYWHAGFDWPAQERRLNAVPHYLTSIDGDTVHFVHVKSGKPALLLTHGWPSAFTEMLPLAERLEADFDLVIPSLPGHLWSTAGKPVTRPRMADTMAALMTRLGYATFGAYGGDVGADVGHWLAMRHPDRLTGLYLIHPRTPPGFGDDPTDDERAYLNVLDKEDTDDGGYGHVQSTRPDTIAAALMDSPAGLAAWIVEKLRAWSDCGGDVERRFSKDDVLTLVTLYWVTGSIGTSFRSYYDYPLAPPREPVDVRTGVTLAIEDALFPQATARRTYSNLTAWHNPGRGGHFFPFEEPDLLAGHLREFFTP